MIPLVAPCITDEDRKYMAKQTLWYGLLENESEVTEFEEEFAEYVGCEGAVAVSSGTNALLIALQVLTGPDAHIAIPSYTCRAILDAVKMSGRKAVLCDNTHDIENQQFGMVTSRDFKHSVVTHMFGVENPLPPGKVIEDMTLSLGAVYDPEYGVCSFHRDKMISTGRGGMIVSNNEAFLAQCRELAYYDIPRVGYAPAFSFGMTAMQAALGRSQLRQLPKFIDRRQEIAARYTEAFTDAGIACPAPDLFSVFFRYMIGATAPAVKVMTFAKHNIEMGRGVSPPLHWLTRQSGSFFPTTELCAHTLLSVPCHPSLTDKEVGYIIEKVLEVCET